MVPRARPESGACRHHRGKLKGNYGHRFGVDVLGLFAVPAHARHDGIVQVGHHKGAVASKEEAVLHRVGIGDQVDALQKAAYGVINIVTGEDTLGRPTGRKP